MRYITVTFRVGCYCALLFLFCCSNHKANKENNSAELEIGHPLHKDCIILKDSNYFIQTSSSNLSFGKKILFQNVEYSVTLNADKKINFVSTNDTSVKVCDGYKTGMQYRDIPSSSKGSSYNLPGWAYVLEIKGCNWKLGFVLDSNRRITDSSMVGFIFKDDLRR